MKKIVIISVIAVLLSFGLTAQSPEDVIKKCVETLGGEEAVKKHMDFSAEGNLKVTARMMELSGKLKMIQKQGKNWIKANIRFGSNLFVMIRGFDGEKSWMEMMGNVSDQPALNEKSANDHSIQLLINKDAKFSAGKTTEIEGKKAVGIDVEFNGKKTTFFIDTETYTLVEVLFKDYFFGQNNVKELIEVRRRFLDYQMIDGVFFPRKQMAYQKGKKIMELLFDKVVFNPKVDPDIFSRPDQELDLRYGEELMN